MICNLCPRKCGALRNKENGFGFCRMPELPVLARAAVHMWEEPCISGTKGSGTVFFSGCSLRCVFCQNGEISRNDFGKCVSSERLREIYEELIEKGVHNINLVNPTHFASVISKSLEKPLSVPVIYNCGGYESVDTLKMLDGKIDVYLPDIKYSSSEAAKKYSGAADYVEISHAAVKEMLRQTGNYKLDNNGTIIRGVVIRHLILPSNTKNSMGVIDWVSENFKEGEILFSLMAQYTPFGNLESCPEINRRITKREYEKVADYLIEKNLTEGYLQELESADKIYIPQFDLTGI